jgi:hypothetical protein
MEFVIHLETRFFSTKRATNSYTSKITHQGKQDIDCNCNSITPWHCCTKYNIFNFTNTNHSFYIDFYHRFPNTLSQKYLETYVTVNCNNIPRILTFNFLASLAEIIFIISILELCLTESYDINSLSSFCKLIKIVCYYLK